jgi:HD-GYP domain-containing protein (c-di-GMP phosphodiesterase class II)
MADQRLSSNNPSPEVTLQAQLRAEAEALARRTLPELWTDLEAGLGTVLAGIAAGGDAAPKALKRLEAVEARFIALLQRDREAGLFLLFNRSVTHFNGYSTLHALVCAALAWDAASRLPISEAETVSLVRAALTMNVSIKVLQDRMAGQKTKPTQEQMLAIDAHSRDGMRLLHRAGVTDPVWLAVVGLHHDDLPPCPAINDRPTAEKLAKVLQVIDRYSAAMSPRGTRAGRESPQAVKAVLRSPGTTEHDEVGLDLIRNLGLYPPGTFVQLSRGDAAVVLRRGTKLNEPVVASVLNKRGEPVLAPRMFSTEQPEFAVKAGLSGSDIKVRLNEVEMLRHLSSSRLDLAVG